MTDTRDVKRFFGGGRRCHQAVKSMAILPEPSPSGMASFGTASIRRAELNLAMTVNADPNTASILVGLAHFDLEFSPEDFTHKLRKGVTPYAANGLLMFEAAPVGFSTLRAARGLDVHKHRAMVGKAHIEHSVF